MRHFLLPLFLVVTTGCPTEEGGSCKEAADCKKGFGCCAGKCTDVQNDKSNCGECGVVCELPNVTPTCRVGRCQLQCAGGFGNCNGDREDGCEVDLTTTVSHCGLCGRTCMTINAEPVCRASQCTAGTCAPHFANCDMDSTTGCEVDTRTDAMHCGGCDTVCSLPRATSGCEQSLCAVTSCEANWGDCDGQDPNGCEVDLTSNAQHCGACNRACGPRQTCVASTCRANELIVFGGALSFTSSAVTAELSRFDLSTNTFSPINALAPNGAPPARGRHLAAFDFAKNRMLVWGGVDGTGTPSPTDLWALEFATEPPRWVRVTTQGTPPSPRFAPASAVDSLNRVLYVFGGTTEQGTGLSDLFTFDLTTDTWARVHDSASPNAPGNRINAMLAFDPMLRVLFLFGGNDTVVRADLSELWEFDVATRMWKTPPLTMAGGGPQGRARGAFFDGHPLHLWSGVVSLQMAPASMADDLRTLDARATPPWVQLPGLATLPASRFNAGYAARDAHRYVWAGGAIAASGQSTLNDLWRYEPATHTWLRLSDGAGGPNARLAPTLVAR